MNNKSVKTPLPKKNNPNRKVFMNLAMVFLLLGIVLTVSFFSDRVLEPNKNQSYYTELVTLAREGKVSEIELSEDGSTLNAKLFKSDDKNRSNTETKSFPNAVNDSQQSVYELLQQDIAQSGVTFGSNDGQIIYSKKKPSFWTLLLTNEIFHTVLLIGGTLIVVVILLRRLGEMNNKSISFGNSRSKLYDENGEKKITFNDVAGNEEAKQELNEVVDFLKRPEEYAKMGAKIPRGVLLIGSPGNGKTLMARAVAGEAQVPFLYVSGSEFVEMFVGVGASRVRDLFKQAKRKAPCLIFIDEIDAVGRQRGAGLGGGNDEREQTLNQILVEMDGFEHADHVIVIGATNRPDVLDPALLRPGRFDRQVTVTAPDRKEREAILKLHSKNKKFATDVDMGIIAKRTPGFSGADLQNILNEAAILAVREKSTEINNIHAREAIEKVMLGPSLKSKVITENQKLLTAYHEAGHALVQTMIPEASKVQKITIIPRGKAAGYTFHADEENDAITKKKSEFLAEISALMGGYVAEEVIFGEVSTGGSNDLQRATEMSRDMVTKYGMSRLGPISFDPGKSMSFLGRDMMEKQNYSEDSAKLIDLETKSILDQCYLRTKKIITLNVQGLKKIAEVLIDKEVIEYEEFSALTSHLINEG
jgi:cell division protease FtsH